MFELLIKRLLDLVDFTFHFSVSAYLLRGSARCFTPAYREFLASYEESMNSNSNIVKKLFLNKYQFDFSKWSVDMKATYSVSPTSDCHG